MSLYNMLMQTGPNAGLALASVGISDPAAFGRFRDAYFTREGGDIVIAIFTRNGGNNRTCRQEGASENSAECVCPGCIQQIHLPSIPSYIRDYDDDFDSTYCTTLFSMSQEILDMLAEHGFDLEEAANELPPMTRFRGLIGRMERGELEGEESQRAAAVGEMISEQLEQAFTTGEGGEVSTPDGSIVVASLGSKGAP